MALYNFLYKNQPIIQSLNAQIFSGIIKDVKNIESAKTKSCGNISGKALVASVGVGSEDTNEKSRAETIEPHDAMIIDVLKMLENSLKEDLSSSSFGDIICLKGNILIIPKEVENGSVDILFEMFAKEIIAKDQRVPPKIKSQMQTFMKKMMLSDDSDARFLFLSSKGNLRGVLNPEFLSESTKGIVFKYGTRPIPVTMIALNENAPNNLSDQIPKNSLIAGLFMLSGKAQDLFLQGIEETIPVTPIAIFYDIACDLPIATAEEQ